MAEKFGENDKVFQPVKPSYDFGNEDKIFKSAYSSSPENAIISPDEQMDLSGTIGSADLPKLFASGAVQGTLGTPEAIQSGASGIARDTIFKPTEFLNYLSDPTKLANDLSQFVRLPKIFNDDAKLGILPEETVKKQKYAVDEALTKGKIESFKDLSNYGKEVAARIEDTLSPEMKQALIDSQPTGNIIEAFETGDFSKVSFGADPSMTGYAGQAFKVFGSTAPALLIGLTTKRPVIGATAGFGQAGSEGVNTAREHIKSMSNEELAKNSEYFRNALVLGYTPDQARNLTEEKAADTAAYHQGLVGALGNQFTTNLLKGTLDNVLNNVKTRVGSIAKAGSIGVVEEGTQEFLEGVATDLGINKTVVREIGVDSFANTLLGAIGGGPVAATRGVFTKLPDQIKEEKKGQEDLAYKNAMSAVVKDSGFDFTKITPSDILPTSTKPEVTTLNVPVSESQDTDSTMEELESQEEKLIPDNTKQPEEGPLKGLTPAEAIIKRLKPEFQKEYFTLRDEAKQIIAKQKELADQGEDENSSLSIRLEEILSRFDEFNSDKQYRKPIFTKSPNDPAIEKEALALADELEKAGDAVSSDGLRSNISNTGGYTDLKKLDYYKGKLLEAQQKTGVAEEMPKDTYNLDNYVRSGNKAEVKRFNEFLPKAPAEVQDLVARSNGYLQAIADKINSKGYKVSNIFSGSPSGEMRDLRNLLSGIAGSTFRYVKDAEHIANKNRFANPEKMASSLKALENDFSKADQLLGAAPTPAKPTESTELEDYARNTRTDDDRYSLKDIQEAVEKSKKNKKDLLVSMEDFTEKNPERMIPIAEKNGFISINKGENILAAETAADVERNKNNYNNNPDSYDNQKARALANLKDKEGSITGIKESRGISKEYAEKVYNHFLNYHAKKFDYLRDGEYELWDKLNKEHNDFMARLNAVSKKTKETKKSQAEINQQRQDEKKAKTEKATEVKPKIEDIVSPEVASAMKDIEFQKKLIKANNEKSVTEAQFNKVFNLQQSGKTAEADAQLTKILEKKEKKAKAEEEPEKVPEVEIKEVKEFPKETPVSKEYQTALNKSRKATKAFQSAQDGYRKRLINDEEFIAARKRYDEAMAEYDIAYAKEQEKPEPKEVKPTPKKTAPVSSEEEQLIQDAVMFAKAANRTNLDEDKIRDAVENARIKEPETVITKLKGSVESLKNEAKNNLIRLAAEDYREQIGGVLSKDSELVNAIKGGALNIEGKEYAPAFYKAYNINPDKIKKPTVGNEVDAQIVKFDSGIFAGRDANPETYDKAAVKFLESPLTAKLPSRNQEKIEAQPIKDVTPLSIEKKIVVKNKTYEDHKAALSDITADEDVRYYLKGIYLDKANNRMMATDGHRGAIINNANFDGAPETTKGKDIVALDNSIIEGQFPDMDRVVPKKHLVKSDIIDTKELGNYARGVQKAWRYIASKYNPVILKVGGKDFGFNSDYIVDMSNLFARMGYDTFQASVNENGRLFATSPDNRVQQVVMAMREPSTPFSTYAPKKTKQITKQPETIDVEATEITPSQIKLLTNQVGKLSDADIAALEEHYGVANYSSDFMKRIREDVVTYINKGADAVDAAIRSIIAKLQAGLLSIAVVFNPATFQTPDFNIPRFIEETRTVSAPAPQRAEMSAVANKAYSITAPAFIKANQAFFIADKPNGKIHLFDTDGKFLKSSDALYGKQAGDILTAEAREKPVKETQDIDKVTPAGVFSLSVNKNPDYTGGYVLRFTDNKGDMGGVAIHAVYTGDVKENREAKLVSKDPKDKKITFGCINVDASFFTGNIIPRINKMENAGVVVIPDAQEQLDLFVKPTTEKVSAPAKEVKTEERTKIVGRETPYYNDFTSNLDERYFDNQIVKTREEKITDYAQVRAATRRLTKKVAKYGSDIPLQRELNTLLEVEEGIKSDLDMTKPLRNTAANFMAKATDELAEKNITPEVEAFIRNAFEKNPALLQGLRLSVRSQGDFGRDAGNFNPYARIVTLWKDSSGVEDAKTIRHELTHSLEQMMMPETKKVLVDQWARAFERAIKNNVDEESQNYFQAVLEFNKNPSKENFDKATEIMPPSYDYYQYMNPSEYWAVNAEAMLGAKLGGSWTRFTNAIKKLLEGLKSFFGMNNKYEVHKAMDKILSGDMKRINNETLADYLLRGKYKINFLSNVSPRKNYKGNEAPLAEWNNPTESKLDNFIYEIQDKLIDTKRVIQEIEKTAGKTAEKWNVYMREELYHGRTSTRIVKFLRNDLSPIVKEMQKNNITIPEFDQYLHNRHAEERNIQVAKINPNMPDQGSGIKTIDANNYLNKLDPQKKKVFESLAKKADEIIKETQDILVKNGVESEDTINAWNDTYKHYVPLMREDLDYVHHGKGYGQGYQVKGPSSKRATGSKKTVVDIFSTIALQRERAIIRSEKLRVGRALFGLVLTNPNPEFWLPINPDAIKNKEKLESELINMGLQPEDAKNFIQEPKAPRIDKRTGKVIYEINPALRNSDNVFAVRIDGKERYIIFNANDSRAMRMVESLKNLDAEQLGIALGSISQVTRYFASINTQYNPIFGIVNFSRDIPGAALNLSTTELKGKEAQVMAGVFPALFGIYGELRADRKDKTSNAYYAKLFEDFSLSGGKTGYKDQFTKRKITRTGFKFESSQVNIVEQAFEDLNKKTLRKAVDSIFNWLSDYNDAMENAVRLSVYKVGLDMGLSKDRAASIAKNITVNFNRKGATSSTLNSLYAFFGSAVQGTARLVETLKGPSGRKIIAGGFILGAVQAIALAMAGFDDEEPKTFVKDKNMVLPIGDGKYITIPLPLGFNVLPGIGRITTEAILGELGLISTNKSLPRRALDIANLILDSFNPLGGGQLAQVITPTIADPIIGIATNRDTFGRPISREDRPSNPTPGYTRSRENANVFSKYLAEILNDISGGTAYKKGLLSPTADQIDYLVGQATGGVGREIQKSFETVKSQSTGEDQPIYRVPLLGRVYGDVNTPAAITSSFYENIKIMAEHENEIKGRAKNKGNVSEYQKEYPESKMISYANQVESDVAKINKLKKELIQLDQPKDKIQKLENQKVNIMRLFNNRLKAVKKEGE